MEVGWLWPQRRQLSGKYCLCFYFLELSFSVYDLLYGCSLIAKGEDLDDGDIEFLSFWDNQEDHLVVLSQTKNFVIVCISEELYTAKDGEESFSREVKELQADQTHDLKYSSDNDDGGDDSDADGLNDPIKMPHDIFVCGSTMWIVEMGNSKLDSIHITRVMNAEFQREEIPEQNFTRFTDMLLFVGEGVALVTDSYNTTRQRESAFIWNTRDFLDKNGWRTEIINGTCIAWERVAKYIVTWDLKDNGISVLYLYSSCPQEGKMSNPTSHTELGTSIIGVEAAFLNRQSWCFEKVDMYEAPLICLLQIKKKEIDFLVWDPSSKKILRRIIALPRKVGS